mgnify:CR=1 FL=1
MKDPKKGGISTTDAAEACGCTVPILRRWMWRLDIVPICREERTYESTRGRRVGFAAFYSHDQVEQLKQGMARRRKAVP